MFHSIRLSSQSTNLRPFTAQGMDAHICRYSRTLEPNPSLRCDQGLCDRAGPHKAFAPDSGGRHPARHIFLRDYQRRDLLSDPRLYQQSDLKGCHRLQLHGVLCLTASAFDMWDHSSPAQPCRRSMPRRDSHISADCARCAPNSILQTSRKRHSSLRCALLNTSINQRKKS